MCGVAGAFFLKQGQSINIVRYLNQCHQHRGPDEAREQSEVWFTLGHTRLSINAVGPAGQQPLASTDGRWLVSFNGEIYNHRELRQRYNLHELGPADGAVIPELIARHGPESLVNLRGMYAFIAVDLLAQQVIAAVDPFGIKPLHWCFGSDGLIIASEPLPLVPFAENRQIDTQAIATFLHRGALDNASTGIVGLNRIRPGTWLRFDDHGVIEEGSTCPPMPPVSSQASWTNAAATFSDSVRAHLLSDVPVALLMSDGVDSTAIAVEIARAGTDVTALTVDLGGGARSEAGAARDTCARLGIEHQIINSIPDLGDIQDFLAAMQRPTVDGLNTYLVLAAVRKLGFSVAISGIGGDETLAGYTSRREFKITRFLSKTPPTLTAIALAVVKSGLTRQEVEGRLNGINGGRLPANESQFVSLRRQVWPVESVLDAISLLPHSWTSTAFTQPLADRGSANAFSEAQIDLYLTGQLLPDADAFSMAHSVELRVPFVDVPFAQSVFAIPKRRIGKLSLVRAMASAEVTAAQQRRKQGFSLPMEEWMRDGVLTPAVSELFSASAPIRDSLEGAFVDKALESWTRHQIKWHQVWALAVLNRWLESLKQ